ncbi:MAG: CpaF family protein [Acidobacteria bacterium]|nr:CpaF family protein [Acidobacteriota bacterium]
MALRDRLKTTNSGPVPRYGEASAAPKPNGYHEIKARLHGMLIDRMDLAQLNVLTPQETHVQVAHIANALLTEEDLLLSQTDRERLVEELRHELFGLGPLEPLLADPTISDILVNSPHQVYVERGGKLERTNVTFNDNEHVIRVIERIVTSVGRRIDEGSPMVDARLPDGSRVNAVIPPVMLDGATLSIRRFGAQPLRINDLIRKGALPLEIAQLLEMCVKARLNIVVSGGTGAGKTTLLNSLSAFIPSSERIVTIEDSAELLMQQQHVLRMETRPPNVEGRGEITQRDLVKNALRMRPDRIVVGEVRSGEAVDMLQAMNTGHDGSLTTIHANTPPDALTRLETMVQMAGMRMSDGAIRQQIVAAIDLIVQVARFSDGTRRVTSLTEVQGLKRKQFQTLEIFRYERQGIDEQERVVGRFRFGGVRPHFAERLAAGGLFLPPGFFDEPTL